MRCNVMEFWSFCDSTSNRVKNASKPIKLLTVSEYIATLFSLKAATPIAKVVI